MTKKTKTMSKTMKWIIGIVIAFIAFVIVVAPKTEPEPKATPTPTPIAEEKEYSAFEAKYMEGCLEEAEKEGIEAYSYCLCTYDYLVDALGMSGLLNLAEDYDETGDYSEEMLNAIDYCLDEL